MNAAKMASLNGYGEGGCSASITDSAGVTRGYAIKRQDLPFALPAIQHDAASGRGNGRVAHFMVRRPTAAPVAFSCWMPKTTSPTDAISAMQRSKNGRWSSLFRMLPAAPVIPDSVHRHPLSNEVQAFAAQELASPSAPAGPAASLSPAFNSGCIDVHGDFEWYSDDGESWIVVEVDIDVCDDDGGGDIFEYAIDGGYDVPPHVIVDASSYSVTDLDSVTFTAEVVSSGHLPPLGWHWTPADGFSSDPWTIACVGPATTCRIAIHGSGTMTYTVQDPSTGDPISGDVIVIGNLAPDIELDDDDGDAPSSADSTSGPTNTVELTASESQGVYNAALASGEWLYTQGCVRCRVPHGTDTSQVNAEEMVNYSLRRGDCTDLVQYSHQTYLGLTAWPFQKMSTTQFNNWGATPLAKHGFTQITDSTQVRVGDVVVKTLIGGNGHAGLFQGWAAHGQAEAYANNGTPATPSRKRNDGKTGRWTATKQAGYVVKYFRARKVAP